MVRSRLETYYKCPYGHVLAAKHPECPCSQPTVTFLGCEWEYGILQKSTQNRPVVAFVNTRYRDG
jgi:hypothetical protein